jgi:hypothetical protein
VALANGNAFSCEESSGSLYDSIEKELVSDMKISLVRIEGSKIGVNAHTRRDSLFFR